MIAMQTRDSSATRTKAVGMPSPANCRCDIIPVAAAQETRRRRPSAQRLVDAGDIDAFAARRHARFGGRWTRSRRKARNRIRLVHGGVERDGQDGRGHSLALAELEAATGALASGLFALFDARVAGQVAQLAQDGPIVRVGFDQGLGDAVAQRAGLAGDAAAEGLRPDIETCRRSR